MKNLVRHTLSYFLLIFSLPANAQSFLDNEFLTGDWGGFRSELSANGIDLIPIYKLESWQVPNAGKGNQSSYYIQNLDFDLIFDFDKLFGISGGTLLFDWQMMNGQAPNADVVKSVQGVSNIETWNNYLVYEFWYQQNLFENKLSILFGLLDLNREFDAKPSKSNFLTPAHGIGTDFALTGLNGPSIFPVTSLALRAGIQITDEWSLRVAVFDGIPGDTSHPVGTHVVLRETDGLLVVLETDFINFWYKDKRLHSHVAIGAWYYTDSYYKIASGIKQWGFYVFGEYPLFIEPKDNSQGLSSSLRLGYSDPMSNITDFFIGAALEYKGLFPGRDDDYAGLGFAMSQMSEHFKNDMKVAEGLIVPNFDANIELIYSFQLTPFLALQPTLEYFINPALNFEKSSYFVAGIRTNIAL